MEERNEWKRNGHDAEMHKHTERIIYCIETIQKLQCVNLNINFASKVMEFE